MATPKKTKTLLNDHLPTKTCIHPLTPQPQRRSLCINQLPTSLPNSPLLLRRKTLATNSTRPIHLNIQQQLSCDFPNLPLPPIPQPRSRTNSVGPINTHTPSNTPKHTMWLIEISNSNYLPVQIEIVDGLNAPYLQPQQQLNIHSSQRMEVFTILGSNGMKYFLPLNSSVRFGFPSRSKSVLKRVSDLMTLPVVPKVISPQITVSRKQYTYAEKGEILIIYEVSEQSLKCYSQQKKAFVTLEHNLKGNFTTDPVATQVSLKDLTDVIPNAFPCEAKIFLPTQIQSTVPEMQSGNIVTISERTFITSLVATAVDNDIIQYLLLPMIGDMGMATVRLVSTQNVKTNQHLHKMTQHINNSFQFTDFTFTRNITDSNVCNLQTQLFKEVIQSTEDGDDVYVRMFSPTEINSSSDEESIYDIPEEIKSIEQKNMDFLASFDIFQVCS